MRKALLSILFALPAATGLCAPFLVCDPYPFSTSPWLNPSNFIISGLLANAITTPAQINVDGSAQLHYDLGSIPFGNYSVTVVAVNSSGGISSPSFPFAFILGVPMAPTNVHLSQT